MPDTQKKIDILRAELARLDARREKLIEELARLDSGSGSCHTGAISSSRKKRRKVDNQSSPEKKVKLFLSLFRGRQDVYARRFESRRTGKSGYQPACKNE